MPKRPAKQCWKGPARWRLRQFLFAVEGTLLMLMVLRAPPAQAEQTFSTTYDTYGEIGLLDMPSAHMAPDGELALSVGDVGNSQRYALSFQALPWLSASFRYSHIVGLHSGYDDWHYYDRSFGAKFRLFKEGNLTPDVSLGIRDVLGTGLYAAEYLNASKHVGDFDLTAGIGWGRLAERSTFPNPFGYVFKSFKTRKASNTTGLVNFGQFFHGPNVGVFGGIAWQTPIDGLKVLAEYSSDAYDGYVYGGSFKVRSPVNLGLAYRPSEAFAVSAGWFYGGTYGFTVNLSGDATSEPKTAERLGPKVPEPAIRSRAEQQQALGFLLAENPWQQDERRPHFRAASNRQDVDAALYSEGLGIRDVETDAATLIIDVASMSNARAQCAKYAQIASQAGSGFTTIAMSDLAASNGTVTFCPIANRTSAIGIDDVDGAERRSGSSTPFRDRLNSDMAGQGLFLEALSVEHGELWLYYSNGHYRVEDEAIGRIARLLMADAPPSVEIFHLVSIQASLPTQEVTIVRSALERTFAQDGSTAGLDRGITFGTAPRDNPALEHPLISYPRFSWSADPKLTQHIFDPNAPLQFQFYGQLLGDLEVSPGLTLGTMLTGNIWNNLTFKRAAGSALPHVRTDLLQYLKQGQNGIAFLGGIYRTRLSPDVYAELKAGYLEDMYMGAGGDVLWRPEGSRLAFGVDIYQVWKRNFDRLFGIQSYNILTGHASVYYRSPWYGLNFKLHVGRYLAGDYGGTFEITRRFSTGVEVGFYATFTNVPFHKFGEGSFDKGIIIHIPFEWTLPIFSQSSYDLHLSSLTRDGGQRLENDDSLYDETERTSDGEIAQHFDQIITP